MTTLEQLKQRDVDIEALRYQWTSLLPDLEVPEGWQFIVWLECHITETMLRAIFKTARKCRTLDRQMTFDHAIRFCSSVANSIDLPPRIETIQR